MTRLLEVSDELKDLHAELAKLEKVLAEHPQFESLLIDFYSLSKRQQQLEEEFRELANAIGCDVVR